LDRSGIVEPAVVDGEAPVSGLSEDIGKTAIPQYLVDKIRSAGVDDARKDGCPLGCDRYPISAERLKPTPFGHSAVASGMALPDRTARAIVQPRSAKSTQVSPFTLDYTVQAPK
jgi:hypothetical protein